MNLRTHEPSNLRTFGLIGCNRPERLANFLRVRVKFSLGVRVSGMIRVRVDVEVRVSNLLGSD